VVILLLRAVAPNNTGRFDLGGDRGDPLFKAFMTDVSRSVKWQIHVNVSF
jgi:hypothetical protein